MKLDPLRKELRRRLREARRLRLLLDFDGTLSPIVRDPARARLGKAHRQALEKLVRRRGVEIFVLSGRPRRALRRLVGIPGISLLGDHGFDAERLSPKLPKIWTKLRREIREELERIARQTPGSLLETKPATFAIHYRRLVPSRRAVFLRKLTARLRPLERRGRLRLRRGKMVLEILPSIPWGKGEVARRLAVRSALLVAIGDDRTDEEMFRASPRAVTVKVGPGPTAARFRLRDADAVARALSWIGRNLGPYSRP